MATRHFIGIADAGGPGEHWSIIFPQFPGVTSVAENAGAIMQQAKDALASAVEDMEADGEALPSSHEEGGSPDWKREAFVNPHVLLVPVEVSGRSVRVNISLDEGLLGRIDDVAKRTNTSRSALLARGARLILAETPP